MDRVILFVDYQNAFRGARDLFYDGESIPATAGQFDPLLLGQLLVERGLPGRELREVRIYRGRPSPTKDPSGYAASRSQIRHWQEDPRVTVITRPLRHGKVHYGRLTIGNQLPYCHWLSAEVFALIADPTDYRKRS